MSNSTAKPLLMRRIWSRVWSVTSVPAYSRTPVALIVITPRSRAAKNAVGSKIVSTLYDISYACYQYEISSVYAPSSQERMIQLGGVRVQVLLPYLRTTGEECSTGNEEKVQNHHT